MKVDVDATNPFLAVIGHGQVIELLRRELEAPAQSYLFVGPSSVGKGTVAQLFAATLLTSGQPGEAQRRALGGVHPDLVVIEPDGKASITVDQARSTVAQASLAPMEGDRKVFLLPEAGMLNDEAANALLKTLEEPTASTVFVLVAESEDELPDTIASRCRTVVFGRVSDEEIAEGLVGLGATPEAAEQAARISGGRPGLARALTTRPEVAEYRRAWLSIPMRVNENPGNAFRLADEVVAAAGPLLAALKERHDEEAKAGDAGGSGRTLRDRQERELKRANAALYTTGLEILAGFYRDAAAAQFGAPVRNPDVPVGALARVLPSVALANAQRVLETIEALESHQRPQLAFASLFSDLGAAG